MKSHLNIIILALLTTVCLSYGFKGSNGLESSSLNIINIGEDSSNLSRLVRVDSFLLEIVPPASGVQFYKDKIVFLSMSKNERKMSPSQISFGAVEAYSATVFDSIPGKHEVFSPAYSFTFPCDAMTFSRDYRTAYFTRLTGKLQKEKIFMAKISVNNKNLEVFVPEPAPLDFCAENSNYSHPALSANDSMMVFSSDQDGSLGGMDLYVSKRSGGKWSKPENLGNTINTKGNEFFPFLDSQNNLFFSSDKLPGLGGYDIFSSKFNGTGWDKPVRLSIPVNSADDDIAFTMNKNDGKTAFFTRRSIINGNLQLFRISIKPNTGENSLLAIFNGNPVPKTNLIAKVDETINEKALEKTPEKTVEKNVSEKNTKNKTGISKSAKPSNPKTTNTKPENSVKETVKPVNPGNIKTTKIDSIKPDYSKAKSTETPKTANTKNTNEKVLPSESSKKITANLPETVSKTTDAKIVVIKPTEPVSAALKDVVLYRVQILASNKPKKEKTVIINGESYNLWEYFYLGAYRYSIGEFRTLQPAIELQKVCRQSYPQAFVAAFKNDTRSIDVKTFK
jgi:hypothetical protein